MSLPWLEAKGLGCHKFAWQIGSSITTMRIVGGYGWTAVKHFITFATIFDLGDQDTAKMVEKTVEFRRVLEFAVSYKMDVQHLFRRSLTHPTSSCRQQSATSDWINEFLVLRIFKIGKLRTALQLSTEKITITQRKTSDQNKSRRKKYQKCRGRRDKKIVLNR